MMIKYGIAKEDVLNYVKEQLITKRMDFEQAKSHCKKHDIEISELELKDLMKR